MHSVRRREFIRTGLGALGLGAVECGGGVPSGPESPSPSPSPTATPATGAPVSIVSAPDYDSSQSALRYACSLIGGLAPLVRGKSVAVKVNITGWGEELLGMPATETYIVHGSVVAALTTALAEAGAASIRLLESV